jgi:LacI family transcriptional regulator
MNIFDSLLVNSQRGTNIASQLSSQLVWLIATGALKPGERLPSIRAMATRLGIHHHTVRAAYRQLEAQGMLETRQGSGSRVLAYEPQRLARLAGETRTHTIGVLLPGLSNPFYQAVLEGIEESAEEEGALVFVGNTHDDPLVQARYFTRLAAKRVDGILIVSQEADWLERDRDGRVGDGLPVVSLDCPGEPGDVVLIDLEGAGYLATRHLIEHGHRRIGLVTYAARLDNVAPIENGYLRALEEVGVELREDWIGRAGGFDAGAGEAAAGRLLSGEDRPSAIFAITDLMAVGVLRIAKSLGLSIPQDLALVGFNDIPLAGLLDPPLTTVRAPAAELGRQGMRLLQRRISGGQGQPERIMLPVSLVLRMSCGCSPA